MSLSRFLNICRPVSAEWTSIILTFPTEIWVEEENGDKDESVTREREKQQCRKTERERHISSHPDPTSRHAWMVAVWAEREGRGKRKDGEDSEVLGKEWGMSPRGQPSPLFIIQQGLPPNTNPQGTAPQGGHNTQRRKRQRRPHHNHHPTHKANSGANSVTLKNARAQMHIFLHEFSQTLLKDRNENSVCNQISNT